MEQLLLTIEELEKEIDLLDDAIQAQQDAAKSVFHIVTNLRRHLGEMDVYTADYIQRALFILYELADLGSNDHGDPQN